MTYTAVYVFSSVICKKDRESTLVKLQTIPNQDGEQRCMQDEIMRSINVFYDGQGHN